MPERSQLRRRGECWGAWVTSETARVTAVNPEAQTITAVTPDGRTLHMGPDDIGAERLGYSRAITAHRSQGATVDVAHVLDDGGGRELAYPCHRPRSVDTGGAPPLSVGRQADSAHRTEGLNRRCHSAMAATPLIVSPTGWSDRNDTTPARPRDQNTYKSERRYVPPEKTGPTTWDDVTVGWSSHCLPEQVIWSGVA